MTAVLLLKFDPIVRQVDAPRRRETVRALCPAGQRLAPIPLLPALRSTAVAS